MTQAGPLKYSGHGTDFTHVVHGHRQHTTLGSMMAGCYAVHHGSKRAASRCIGEHLHGSGWHGHRGGSRRSHKAKRGSRRRGRRTRGIPAAGSENRGEDYLNISNINQSQMTDLFGTCDPVMETSENMRNLDMDDTDEELRFMIEAVYDFMFCSAERTAPPEFRVCGVCSKMESNFHCTCGAWVCDPSSYCMYMHDQTCKEPENPFEALDEHFERIMRFAQPNIHVEHLPQQFQNPGNMVEERRNFLLFDK